MTTKKANWWERQQRPRSLAASDCHVSQREKPRICVLACPLWRKKAAAFICSDYNRKYLANAHDDIPINAVIIATKKRTEPFPTPHFRKGTARQIRTIIKPFLCAFPSLHTSYFLSKMALAEEVILKNCSMSPLFRKFIHLRKSHFILLVFCNCTMYEIQFT